MEKIVIVRKVVSNLESHTTMKIMHILHVESEMCEEIHVYISV